MLRLVFFRQVVCLMGILTATLALLSCALIAVGVWLVLRDARGRRLAEPVPQNEPVADVPRAAAPKPLAEIVPPPPSREGAAGEGIVRLDPLEADVMAALQAVNGAFAPAGIALQRHAAGLTQEGGTPIFMRVALMAGHRCAGLLTVGCAGEVIEIAAVSEASGPGAVSRARRLTRQEASIPSLAEAIAACAWPVVTAVVPAKPESP